MAGRKAGSIEYKKVTRRIGSVITYHQLWKGPDHFLLVKEVGWIEEYKRFYFNDIQSITVRRTASYLVWALVLPVLTLFVMGIGQANGAPSAFYVFTGSIFLVVWLLNMMQGPTCSCWIQTGINKEKLLMFRRVRQVRRFWKKIKPELSAVQGEFSLEEMEKVGLFTERAEQPSVPTIPPELDSEAGAD